MTRADAHLSEDRGPGAGRLLLTFTLGGERLALDVAHVAEVLPRLHLTPVPRADRLAPALMNVRGNVVPVIDLRHRLSLPPAQAVAERFLVLAITSTDATMRLAVEADDVDRIVEVDEHAIEPVPAFGLGLPQRLVAGVTRLDGCPAFLLDPATVFDPATLPGGSGPSPEPCQEGASWR